MLMMTSAFWQFWLTLNHLDGFFFIEFKRRAVETITKPAGNPVCTSFLFKKNSPLAT
jgi:hypothetical protein